MENHNSLVVQTLKSYSTLRLNVEIMELFYLIFKNYYLFYKIKQETASIVLKMDRNKFNFSPLAALTTASNVLSSSMKNDKTKYFH